MASSLQSLIKRLNPVCMQSFGEAASICKARTHYEADITHIFAALLERDDTDIHRILRAFDQSEDRLRADIDKALGNHKAGNTGIPSFSGRIEQMLEGAWKLASVELEAPAMRSGHLLLAGLQSTELGIILETISPIFGAIDTDKLKTDFENITDGSVESDRAAAEAAQGKGPSTIGKGELGKYTINMTERAKAGEIDPVLGRDAEIRQMVDILSRRRQNNPILTGEAGVGKTAVVEGLAQRIANDDVPPILHGVTLLSLDLGLLQAGASVKGEFERRLRAVIDEVKKSPDPIIMFIDEAHTLIGAGGQAGQGDAANLLKPALARGELRTIAATTWSEYKKYFEKDPALTRRFQVVKVEEPDEERAIIMLRGVADTMEKHHKVRVLDEAIDAAVRLSNRYLAGRQLPDKAVSLLDTACARVKISQNSTPAAIEDITRRLEALDVELNVLRREQKIGVDHADTIAALEEETANLTSELANFQDKFTREKALVEKLDRMRSELEGVPGQTPVTAAEVEAGSADTGAPAEAAEGGEAAGEDSDAEPASAERMAELTAQLEALQGETPLVYTTVTGATIAEVLSAWTGIPLGSMVKDEITSVLTLHETLGKRVIGQNHALDIISRRIRTARANLDDPGKPIGVFMLVGTSGVGKTETALALADLLYGGERNIITINMSEYQEAHTVSNLKGSPRGYVGYGEGGVLTEAVRRRPYSVVLLDEVEKAHPDVMELFFQVFDKGNLEDGEGREIDFKNCVIILTSNVGTDTIMSMCGRGAERPEPDDIIEAIRPDLNKKFKPALLGRMVLVPFYPMDESMLDMITRLKLNKIVKRIKANHGADFTYSDEVVKALAERCTDSDAGARNIDNILTGTILPEISAQVLGRMADNEPISTIALTADENGGIGFQIT